jgi:two-component system, OmpR family, osmolarity sensor histidine kinase EnvZ
MCSCLKGSRVAAERRAGRCWSWLAALAHSARYPTAALAVAALLLALLQLFLGRHLARQQLQQQGAEVTANLLLGEVALERFSPESLAALSGMRLGVGPRPAAACDWQRPGSCDQPDRLQTLRQQARQLQRLLCLRLGRCPLLLPAAGSSRGVWVEMLSPLETVWLFVPLPDPDGWPPDPWLLLIALLTGGLAGGLLHQLIEVNAPLRRLQEALTRVGEPQEQEQALPPGGSPAVRQLSRQVQALQERLVRGERERRTMLAGIAHDLRAPLTRLRLRTIPAVAEGGAVAADLDALERITAQFLQFAGADSQEPAVLLPLQELLAETAAVVGELPLELDLMPLQRRVRPTALARAVRNLLENAIDHGQPPLRLVLRPGEGGEREGFRIEVWDQGAGIAASDWQRALTPFVRLDGARRGRGHSGLGLAIAARIARDHGGQLRRLEGRPGFGVGLSGHSLAPVPEG